MFKIYEGETVVVEGESPLTITGLDPDTNVAEGTYQVVRLDGDKESDRVDIPAFKTLPIAVTGVTVAPKTKTADSGTAGSEQLAATVAPGNATNKAVTYSIAPQTEGLSVDASGKIDWTAAVPSGTYTTTIKTTEEDFHMFKIYEGETVVVEGESPLTITGLDPDTNVAEGTYQVVRLDGDKESDRVDIPAFKTLPIAVTGVTVAPKTKTADSGTAGSEQLAATVAPGNATNKAVTYSIAPQTEGLSVDASGKIDWTAAVPSGTYTTTIKTTEGETVVVEGESPLTITGLDPDTNVAEGTYQVVRLDGDKESDRVDIPAFKTLPIAVTGVTVAPKTKTADSGTAGSEQLAATVAPGNATNKAVTYSIAPQTEGLSVDASGKIDWTAAVPSGTYTTTIKTTE